MSDFNQLYEKINNKSLVVFEDYFNVQFYLNYQDGFIQISQSQQKNFDYINIKCRKLTKQNWDTIKQQEDEFCRQKLLLVFSIVQTNFLQLKLTKNCLQLQSLNKLLKLHPKILKFIIEKIYDQSKYVITNQYRNKILMQFDKLYNSEKGIVLKHKQISNYLHLCAFYQKLGLNYFDLKKLPYDLYQQLSMMIGIQTQIKNRELQKINKKGKSR